MKEAENFKENVEDLYEDEKMENEGSLDLPPIQDDNEE